MRLRWEGCDRSEVRRFEVFIVHLGGDNGRNVRSVANAARAVAAVAKVGIGEVFRSPGGVPLVTTADGADLSSVLVNNGKRSVVGRVVLQSV